MSDIENLCNEILIYSGQLFICSMIVPIIVGIYFWNELKGIPQYLWLYCLISFLLNILIVAYIEIVSKYTSYFEDWLELTGASTNFFQIFHQLVNFTILGWFFSQLLKDLTSERNIKFVSITLCIASILFYVYEQGWQNYGKIMPPISALFLFILPFLYLWYLYQTDLTLPLKKNPFFWICLGLIIPNIIGLFLYFVGDSIYNEDFCLFARFSTAKNVFEILGQIFIAIGFSYSRFSKYLH